MFTFSSKFAIRDSSSNATATSPDPEAPTVTINCGPDPLKNFVTTFPANANGVESGKVGCQGVRMQVLAVVVSVVMCVVGGVVIVLWVWGIRYSGFNVGAWLRLVVGVGIGAGKLGCSLRASV